MMIFEPTMITWEIHYFAKNNQSGKIIGKPYETTKKLQPVQHTSLIENSPRTFNFNFLNFFNSPQDNFSLSSS